MTKNYSSNIKQVINILEKHFRYTERTTLNRMRKLKKSNINAFRILISCLLSLRAKDENTERISKQLFLVADNPQSIINLPLKKLERIIYSSGHYKKKARTLKHVSKVLLKEYGGKVPNNKEKLLVIKGIGPKTANIVLCFAFGECVIPVDVHVHIVSNRLGWVRTKNPEKTELELKKILPKKYWKEINGLFVLHGKKFCQSFSSICSQCPLKKLCPRIGITRSR